MHLLLPSTVELSESIGCDASYRLPNQLVHTQAMTALKAINLWSSCARIRSRRSEYLQAIESDSEPVALCVKGCLNIAMFMNT